MLKLTGFGAIADAIELRDAVIWAGSATLGSASAPFSPGDVGKKIVVAGAGAAGVKLCSTITDYETPTSVTLAHQAATPVSSGGAVFGTDCAPALTAALDQLHADKGGTLLIDGLFLLASPVQVSFGAEAAGISAEIIGEGGSASAFWIGVPSSGDAISITTGSLRFEGVNFVGVPGASRDARRVLNLAALAATFERCTFMGLLAAEAVIYASECYLDTKKCDFGGCFVAGGPGGYVNSVIENKNWRAYHDEFSEFIDYGYFRGAVYSKSGHSGTQGWVRGDTQSQAPSAIGARAPAVFRMEGTRMDEGSLHGVVIKPTTGVVSHVHLSDLRHNVTGGDTGRGIHCEKATSVTVERSWYGLAATPRLLGHFQDCGTVLIDSLKLTESVNSLSATNVEALILKDTSGITSFSFSNVNFHPVTSRFGSLAIVKNGAVSDADFPAPPAIGTLGFDRTNNRLFLNRLSGGGWIYFPMGGGDPFGPELIANGTFDSNTNNWPTDRDCILSSVAGALRIANGASGYGRAYQVVPTVPGQKYQISAGIGAGDAVRLVRAGTSLQAPTYVNFINVGPNTATFTAATAATYITLSIDHSSPGKYGEFDNVSLKAI